MTLTSDVLQCHALDVASLLLCDVDEVRVDAGRVCLAPDQVAALVALARVGRDLPEEIDAALGEAAGPLARVSQAAARARSRRAALL